MKEFKKPKDDEMFKNVNAFIDQFNKKIDENKFSMNTELDQCPKLNEGEFAMAAQRARNGGYKLNKSNKDAFFGSITYKLYYDDWKKFETGELRI